MTSNIQQAKNRAVELIEKALIEAGWSDGWALGDDEVRRAPSPLFYRNSTPAVAEEAKVSLDGQTHMLYCIYNIADDDPHYSGNRWSNGDITVALTFYYDDPFIFYEKEGESNNSFVKFMNALLEELARDLWAISGDVESSSPSGEDGKPYANRTTIFATNNF